MQTARLDTRISAARLRVDVRVTAGGLLAIGGLVSMILLSSAAIVRAARTPADAEPRRGALPSSPRA